MADLGAADGAADAGAADAADAAIGAAPDLDGGAASRPAAPPLPHSLATWGWDEDWSRTFEAATSEMPGLSPARVMARQREVWFLVGETGEFPGAVTGKFRRDAEEGWLPAVGDWVGAVPPSRDADDDGRDLDAAQIDVVLPRRTCLTRRAAGRRVEAQVVATNIDTLFIATSLNGDLNPRRLDRYVAMGHESGAETVLLLTKADLVDEADSVATELAETLRVPVLPMSSRTGSGLAALEPWLLPERTVALVGSSGVGKSTLLNRLAGRELMATSEIREDDSRGRHTTSHRELFLLPNGAMILDTPGMRELGLWDATAALDDTFADLVELAEKCRYPNCAHRIEPGCAIQAAVRAGRFDYSRVRSYRLLSREASEQSTAAAAAPRRRGRPSAAPPRRRFDDEY